MRCEKLARGSNPPRLRNGKIRLATREYKKSFPAIAPRTPIADSGVPRHGFWTIKNFEKRSPTPVSCVE